MHLNFVVPWPFRIAVLKCCLWCLIDTRFATQTERSITSHRAATFAVKTSCWGARMILHRHTARVHLYLSYSKCKQASENTALDLHHCLESPKEGHRLYNTFRNTTYSQHPAPLRPVLLNRVTTSSDNLSTSSVILHLGPVAIRKFPRLPCLLSPAGRDAAAGQASGQGKDV